MARTTTRAAGRTNRGPQVAVDVVVFTLGEDATPELQVLEVRRDGSGWTLPGDLLRDGERLVDTANRALADKAGIRGLRARQVHVLDPQDRDALGPVVSVGHVAVAAQDAFDTAASARLVAAASPGRLPYGHGELVAAAVADLRARYLAAPDPDGLLGDSFSLRELRLVHEAVAGGELQRDTFRRTMEPMLAATGEVLVGGRGRPAELFVRA